MPVRRLPTNFTATRALNLAGTVVVKGASVTAHVAAQKLGHRIGQYVSRGWLVPDVTQYMKTARRSNQKRPAQTYHLSPAELRKL